MGVLILSAGLVAIPSGPVTLLGAFGLVFLGFALTSPGNQIVGKSVIAAAIVVLVFTVAIHQETWLAMAGQLRYFGLALGVATLGIYCHLRLALPIPVFAVAAGIGTTFGAVFQPVGVSDAQAFVKNGFGFSLAFTVFAFLACRRTTRLGLALVASSLSAFFFMADFRSEAAICLLSGISVAVMQRSGHSRMRALVSIIVLCVTSVGIFSLYQRTAEAGVFGPEVQSRYERQSANTSGLLIGARPELIVSQVAISAHPILGRGGEPRLTTTERNEILDRWTRDDVYVGSNNASRLLYGEVGTHSMLFYAWVTGGLLATLLWLMLLSQLVRAFLGSSVTRLGVGVAGLLAFGCIHLAWDLLFSPWSARYEVFLGVLLAVSHLVRQGNGLTCEKVRAGSVARVVKA